MHTQLDPSKLIKLGCKLHVDAVGNHPKVFFVSITLFSIDGLFIFAGDCRIGVPLPKFVVVGSDTHAQSYVKDALREIKKASEKMYVVSKDGHKAVISADPVIISGDGNVRPMFTGGVYPHQQACSTFDVCQCFLYV